MPGGDVMEGQDLVILVNDLGRDFPVDDLGKQSIQSRFSLGVVERECTEGSAGGAGFTSNFISGGSRPC